VNFNDFGPILDQHKSLIQSEVVPEYCFFEGHCAFQSDLLGESGYVLLSRTELGVQQSVSVKELAAHYNLTDYRTYKIGSQRAISVQRLHALDNYTAYPYDTLFGQAPRQAQARGDLRKASILSTVAMKEDAHRLASEGRAAMPSTSARADVPAGSSGGARKHRLRVGGLQAIH
jgi:hypothetical protein